MSSSSTLAAPTASVASRATDEFCPRRLILVPVIVTLGVTTLRLVGELAGWSPVFFSKEAGGAGAIVGIAWLMPIFGAWFGWKLAAAGRAPAQPARAILFAVAGVATLVLGMTAASSMGFTISSLLIASAAAAAGGCIAWLGWRELGSVNFVYGLLARIPVALVMLIAMTANWGTHYDTIPDELPRMPLMQTWLLLGLLPQLVTWVGLTMIFGGLFGSIAGAIRSRRAT